MSEGNFNFKSGVGAIDIHLSDVEKWLKDKEIEGSDGKVFKGYDTIDSGIVE